MRNLQFQNGGVSSVIGEWETIEDGGNPPIRQHFNYVFKLMNKVEQLGEGISERGDTCANVSKL